LDTINGTDVDSSATPEGRIVGVTTTASVKVVWSLEKVTGTDMGIVPGRTAEEVGITSGTLVVKVV